MIFTCAPENEKRDGVDYRTVKAWFQQCRDLAEQVEAQKQKIQRIRDTAEKCTQSMSGMPTGGGAGDKVALPWRESTQKSGTSSRWSLISVNCASKLPGGPTA
jgi:hypothetical protein